MKPRTRIPRLSKKKLAAANGRPIYSTIASPRKAVRKSKRKPSEFARIYGSKARVAFVKSLPCCACKVEGYTENAHIETGGTGYKADYTKIVPLCNKGVGCHRLLHFGRQTFEIMHGRSLDIDAAETETAWQEHQGATK